MLKFFVQFGLFGRWFETYDEAAAFCVLAGYSCEDIYELEAEENA
jgi:hypothetical protein